MTPPKMRTIRLCFYLILPPPLAVNVFINGVEQKYRSNWKKYLVLIVMTAGFVRPGHLFRWIIYVYFPDNQLFWPHCWLHDNGPAFKEEIAGGYGLRSIRDKLNLIYGDKASLQIQNNDCKAVLIRIPVLHEF